MGAENCCTIPSSEQHGFSLEDPDKILPQNAALSHVRGKGSSIASHDNGNLGILNNQVISRNSSRASLQDPRNSKHRDTNI